MPEYKKIIDDNGETASSLIKWFLHSYRFLILKRGKVAWPCRSIFLPNPNFTQLSEMTRVKNSGSNHRACIKIKIKLIN